MIAYQCFFKAGNVEITKDQEYSKFLHKYCDADNARDISDRRSVISIVHIFTGTVIEWCARKKSETSGSSSNV